MSPANNNGIVVPFLKWPGGKRWLVQKRPDLFRLNHGKYIEPFLGGGAVFFYVNPTDALIGDSNGELITAYNGVKNDWQGVEEVLNHHQRCHSDDYYYQIRAYVPSDSIEQTARTIYLNRTCYNGMYRVNLSGKFNVPRGTKNKVILDNDNFGMISSVLKNADIVQGDFEELINAATEGDFIFADPPYTVQHNCNGFIKYNEKLFSWKDQERLATSLIKAQRRGARIVSTNANHHSVRELYADNAFNLHTASRFSSISANINSRKQFEELIILSHS